MGISVGAALKKIAVALVSDKKTLKNMVRLSRKKCVCLKR